MNVSDFCKKSTFPPIITEDLKERIKNLDKEVFFILSTARCRSTWFGNFFTYKDSFCWNEELRYCSCWEDIVDRIEKRPEKYIGFEDPELLHYITTLYELFPNAKYVLLERDRFECENSLKNIISLQGKVHPEILEGNYITRKFDRWYYDIHNMEQIIPEFKRINFYQMNDIKNIKDIWDYLLPNIEFDVDRFNLLTAMVISVTYANEPKEPIPNCMGTYFSFDKLDQIQ